MSELMYGSEWFEWRNISWDISDNLWHNVDGLWDG